MNVIDIKKMSGRMLIVSDCHLGHFEGVAGYSSACRQELLREALLCQPDADGVIFAGDMTSRNLTADFSLDGIRAWKCAVYDPLRAAGIPAFAVNASHDSLTAAEYREMFGMEHHFALRHGDIAYICLDTYAGARDATMQTTPSDIDGDTLREALALADDARVAFVVCHYPNPGENLARLIAHPHVPAVIAGHTHDNMIVPLREAGVDSAKPMLQTGHFSRAHTKRVADGCGFQPFVPMQSGDFSKTGSPWQYRAVARTADSVESYMIFPEMRYGAFKSDGIDFAAFTQPYAEGQGDRSFAAFALGEAHETV